ncbi:MAG: 4-hydroxy-tetrahydrodipicolinate reductase [Candidatus Omnitrophica bacterium]|nr:4-hydroxy-tetrahydrodipicolinate reductase [Candidatus Omnitrophota bacterium]
MIKICVSGSKGKMGSRIIALSREDGRFKLTGGFDIGDAAEPLIKECDCLIEFTTPAATAEHLLLCVKYKKPAVIGTTGLSEKQLAAIKAASAKIPIVFSSNMSIGVNVLFGLVQTAAAALADGYNPRIKEAHHVHKKDAPSGTAKELARIIKEAAGAREIPIDSIREDEIIGDHTVIFEGPGDRIELSHSAKTRDILVKGALEAAGFIAGKRPGLYTMRDVMGKRI